jgi:hypothetical protein
VQSGQDAPLEVTPPAEAVADPATVPSMTVDAVPVVPELPAHDTGTVMSLNAELLNVTEVGCVVPFSWTVAVSVVWHDVFVDCDRSTWVTENGQPVPDNCTVPGTPSTVAVTVPLSARTSTVRVAVAGFGENDVICVEPPLMTAPENVTVTGDGSPVAVTVAVSVVWQEELTPDALSCTSVTAAVTRPASVETAVDGALAGDWRPTPSTVMIV